MSLSAPEIWSLLLSRARAELPEQTFRTWLEPTQAIGLEGDTIIVTAPDRFAAEWNDSKHATLLASYAPIVLGHPLSVAFRVDEERRTRPQMDFFVAPTPESKSLRVAREAEVLRLSERYTFGNFVIGKSNELAAAAAKPANSIRAAHVADLASLLGRAIVELGDSDPALLGQRNCHV